MHQLEGEFQAVISALRSKLDSRAAPPVLHLDTANLQAEPPRSVPSPPSSPGTPIHSDPFSASQDSRQPWSLFTALTEEIQKLRTQKDVVTEDASQSETSSKDSSVDVRWSTNAEDFIFADNTDRTDTESSALLPPAQSTPAGQPTAEATADPGQAVHTVNTRSLHRKYRSLLHKRQIPGASGKSMRHTHFLKYTYTKLYLLYLVLAEFKILQWLISFLPAVCPGVRESSQQVTQVRDSYRWILNIPGKNLRMNFQEVNYYSESEGNAHKLFFKKK